MGADVLSERALNRATLARQHLLERDRGTATEMIDQLAGMQAQAPYPPYVGLWTRVEDFTHDDLAGALERGEVVRLLLYRGTVHLISAADCLALRPLLQAAVARTYLTPKIAARVPDPELVAEQARKLLDEAAMTPAELGARLAERWPERDAAALATVAKVMLPLVQLPPRAVWGVGGATRYATAERWLGASPKAATLPELVRRYLGAFGPASVRDMQTWSGLTRLREITDAMPELRTFRSEHGTPLLDLPGARRPAEDTPSPVRFLPEYDNVLLAYADRARIVPTHYRQQMMSRNGIVPATILVDGKVAGTWRVDDSVLSISPFARLTAKDAAALRGSGAALAEFLGADPDVRLLAP